jgi:hypothetical protein
MVMTTTKDLVMSFYTDLMDTTTQPGTDPFKPFKAKLGQAENLFAEGAEKHGTAAILRVATLAVLIHKGFKINDGTFNVSEACAMARKLFNRLPKHDGTTKLEEMTDKSYKKWSACLPAFFHPYAFNGRTLTPNVKRKAALKEFVKATPPEGTSKEDWSNQILNALDETGSARTRFKMGFETACLLVARDPTGERLKEFDIDQGLLVLEQDLMHEERAENNDLITFTAARGPAETIRIPAVAKRQQMAQGVPSDKSKSRDIRATLVQLRKAAVTPEPIDIEVSKLISAHDHLKAFLTPSRSIKLEDEEKALVADMRSIIESHYQRLEAAEKGKAENRERAALAVVNAGKVSKEAARKDAPGYQHADKDGKAITEEALKAS